MEKYVLQFQAIDKSSLFYVGGKGANLGEMTKAGFPVPKGFCVTTWAYRSFIETSQEMAALFQQLDSLGYDSLEQISKLGQQIRGHLNSLLMLDKIQIEIMQAWEITGKDKGYAVRSSATAEDLPTASFAGQQDTYLNVCGLEQLLKAVQNCWASLFTDRAISYRAKNGFDHRSVYLSVVVQEMVLPEVSGIMFTADPVTGRRKTVSIDASFGLGEALVSGLVTADLYQVRFGKITQKRISSKKVAIYSAPEGGTVTQELPLEKQEAQALPDEQILNLAALGQKVEAHYGSEQDIEWALADGQLYILQSRPITSLYPLPKVSEDKFHVYISVGHIQMMTDVLKPLAISLFQNLLDFLKKEPMISENYFICKAGGRVFADVTGPLLLKPVRKRLLRVMKGMDEILGSALAEVIQREDFRNLSLPRAEVRRTVRKLVPIIIPVFLKVIDNLLFADPSKAKDKLAMLMEKAVQDSKEKILWAAGAERIRQIQKSTGNIVPDVISKVPVYWIAGLLAAGSLEKKLKRQVGEKRSAYLLSQLNKSLPGNVTTELGLKLGDLADTARKYPKVIDYLARARRETFYEELSEIRGGAEFKRELDQFLEEYGMRCTGEIDITKPRWYEDPTQLVSPILSHIRTSAPGGHREKFRQGEIEAEHAAKEILAQFGFWEKIRLSRLLKLYRNLMGMREHHKFAVILHLGIYKRAIMEEAQSFVQRGIFRSEEDVFYLTLEEIIALEEGRFAGNVEEYIAGIKKRYEQYEKLTPPRVMTSEGEIITGKLRDIQAPEGALVGLPVSAGIVEGIARVVVKLEDAKLNPGEILVAPYTDPGWTPLFTSAIGLITEIGGMMTHGSVVAREYGIPAVVGIDKATEIIKDGVRVRVNGTEGYVQIL
ncbi:phosphoenolpyruvate synthase [Peptococcaceae bacterium CEB3]|nr:phosphoenolpyruvate synthase [Peptococcaceae bacterium CEB3]